MLYGVLTGEMDSTGGDELLIGTNARDFTSYGAQVVAAYAGEWGRATHGLEAGLRLHADDVDRVHTEDSYLVVGGELVRDGMPTATTRDTHDTARALGAAFLPCLLRPRGGGRERRCHQYDSDPAHVHLLGVLEKTLRGSPCKPRAWARLERNPL